MDKPQKAGINRRLRRVRERYGWTQEMLAAKIGTTDVNVSRWENGSNPGPYFRRKLCEVFGATVAELGLAEADQEPVSLHKAPQEESGELPQVLWPPSLPRDPYYLLPEREQELQRLLAVLRDPQGPVAIALCGQGGLGKTAMGIELAQRALDEKLFEGVIGESARQELFAGGEIIRVSKAALDFETLLDALALHLGRCDLLPLKQQEKYDAIVQVLRHHRYLILADGLEASETPQALVWQLRSLLGVSRAILTSRKQIRHDFVHFHALKSLELQDSLLFLQQDRVMHDGPQDIPQEKLITAHTITGGVPLALKLLNAQARFISLDRILDQLQHAGSQLYPFIFRQIWAHLSPLAQKLLLSTGRTMVTPIGWEELASTGLAASETELLEAIDQLVRSSLLDISFSDGHLNYTIHQLTRQFVKSDLPELWQEQR